MQNIPCWLIETGLAVAAAATLICCSRPAEDLLTRIADGLPRAVGPWRAAGEDALYDLEGLYGYIDGHAEVYRAYGVERCLSRSFDHDGGGDELVLDVFLMPSAADAFGVFTHDLDGDDAGLGRGSRLRPGWLSLWQGRVFVSVFTADDGPAAAEALLALGAKVTELVPAEGELPGVVGRLPASGLDRDGVRYLHDPMILATHLFIGFDNPLGLGPDTPAALGVYERADGQARLVLVEYPSAAAATAALGAVHATLLEGGPDQGPLRAADGRWRGAAGARTAVAIVVDADTASLASALLDEALTGGR